MEKILKKIRITLLILTVVLGPSPGSKKDNTCLACARVADRHCDVGVLMLHYQVASDSPGGANSISKMSKLAYYRQLCMFTIYWP